MDFNAILIGLGVIVALVVIGKIFSILTRIFFIIILIVAIAVGGFFWLNGDNKKPQQNKSGFAIENVFVKK